MTDERSAPPERLAVVVVNYAAAELIAANLAGHALDPRCEVVLVDNAAGPAARSAAAELAHRAGWRFVAQPGNDGFGAGANAGIAAALAAGAGAVLLLNPDVVLTGSALGALADAALVAAPVAVSPVIRDARSGLRFTGSLLDLRTGDTRGRDSTRPLRRAPGRWRRRPPTGGPDPCPDLVEWLPATCLGLSRAALERLDQQDGTYFADEYFMYWEDVDLSLRLRAAGVALRVLPDVEVTHDAGATQQRGAGGKSLLYYRYTCRNRLLFAARHLGRRRLLGWLLVTPMASWDVLLRAGGRRRLLRDPASAAAALRGTIAGMVIAVRALVGRR